MGTAGGASHWVMGTVRDSTPGNNPGKAKVSITNKRSNISGPNPSTARRGCATLPARLSSPGLLFPGLVSLKSLLSQDKKHWAENGNPLARRIVGVSALIWKREKAP